MPIFLNKERKPANCRVRKINVLFPGKRGENTGRGECNGKHSQVGRANALASGNQLLCSIHSAETWGKLK